MKKTALTLLTFAIFALLTVPLSLKAQYKSIAMGVKLAPDLGWLKVEEENYKTEGIVPGLNWGLITDFYFAENYSFSTGFSVSFHNGKISYPDIRSGAIGVLNRKYRLKYLDVPLMVKMKTNDIGKFRIYGQIGLQPGVRLSSKAKDTFRAASPVFTDVKEWHNIDKQTTLFRASMVVGAGIEYPIDKSTALVAGINFINGLTNVLKGDNSVDASVSHRAVPNAFELNLGIIF